jgi:hypothetical protein
MLSGSGSRASFNDVAPSERRFSGCTPSRSDTPYDDGADNPGAGRMEQFLA